MYTLLISNIYSSIIVRYKKKRDEPFKSHIYKLVGEEKGKFISLLFAYESRFDFSRRMKSTTPRFRVPFE